MGQGKNRKSEGRGSQTWVVGEKVEQFLQMGEDELRGDGEGSWENVDYERLGATQAEVSKKQLAICPL